MAKKAFLVAFTLMTRVVVDVEEEPDNGLEEDLKIVRAAKEQIQEELDDYLCFDNVEFIEEDTEVPYEPGEDRENY